jgi:hypothetical protein
VGGSTLVDGVGSAAIAAGRIAQAARSLKSAVAEKVTRATSKCHEPQFPAGQPLWNRPEKSVLSAGDGLKPSCQQAADGLVGDGWIAGQHAQQHHELVGSRALEIQQDRPPPADNTGATRQIAQRFLADMVADLAGQLQGFLQKP